MSLSDVIQREPAREVSAARGSGHQVAPSLRLRSFRSEFEGVTGPIRPRQFAERSRGRGRDRSERTKEGLQVVQFWPEFVPGPHDPIVGDRPNMTTDLRAPPSVNRRRECYPAAAAIWPTAAQSNFRIHLRATCPDLEIAGRMCPSRALVAEPKLWQRGSFPTFVPPRPARARRRRSRHARLCPSANARWQSSRQPARRPRGRRARHPTSLHHRNRRQENGTCHLFQSHTRRECLSHADGPPRHARRAPGSFDEDTPNISPSASGRSYSADSQNCHCRTPENSRFYLFCCSPTAWGKPIAACRTDRETGRSSPQASGVSAPPSMFPRAQVFHRTRRPPAHLPSSQAPS